MEKLSPKRAQLFLRNKYTVLTMGGTVALRSVNNKKFRRATLLQLNLAPLWSLLVFFILGGGYYSPRPIRLI